MAGKHYIIATQTGYLVDDVTGYPYEFHSKEAAVKALAEEVKTAAQECRRSHKTCSVVGSARKGSVQIRVGGRQGYHLWQRYVINERPGARRPPREERASESVHHATKKKSAAQLDREIAEVLARKPRGQRSPRSPRSPRRNHAAMRDISDDDWDVAMDAILEHDPERAARVWHEIRKSHGFVTAPPTFLKALHEAPADVRWKFEEHVSALEAARDPSFPVFYEMVKHPRDEQIWFKATEALKKPGYKGLLVVWHRGDRKPKKAKQSTIGDIDITQGYYRPIRADKLPPEVFTRFEERR